MKFKKMLTHYAIQFLPCFVAGLLITFAYSMRFDEKPGINWPVALLLAIVLDLGVTWLNLRTQKRRQNVS